MRTKGRKDANWGKRYFVCGSSYTVLYSKRAYARKLYCDQWSCPTCHARKIKSYAQRIMDNCGVHVFVDEVQHVGKKLSRYIDRFIKKGNFYMAIRIAEGKAIIISSHKFDKANRRDKKKFLAKDFPTIFERLEAGRHVSSRREINTCNATNSNCYGIIPGDKVGEWEKLETDEEKAWWMYNNSAYSYKKGKQILKEYIYAKSAVTVTKEYQEHIQEHIMEEKL